MSFTHSVEPIATLSGHEERAWHVAWNPTKPLLSSCSADKSVRLWAYRRTSDQSTGDHEGATTTNLSKSLTFTALTTIATGHTKTVRALAWTPSGGTLATASFDSNIGIWEPEADTEFDGDGSTGAGREWECLALLEGHETECKSIAYSATGTLLASCSRDKTVWIWEVHPDSDFECAAVLMEHTQDVKCVAWHPREELLASASYDDTIKIYLDDPSDDWYCANTLTGHTSTVWSLAWAPRGTTDYLASSSDDLTVRVWRRERPAAPSAQLHGAWQAQEGGEWTEVLCLREHERTVYSISWGVGDGKEGHLGWLASTGADGRINVWEMKEVDGTLQATPIARVNDAHGVHDVNAIAWCPRPGFGTMLSTAGDDGCVRVWDVRAV